MQSRAGLFEYKGDLYPSFLRDGNAMQYIAPVALQFCKGIGLDMGAGAWPLPGAVPRDGKFGDSVEEIPERNLDFIFSSHCLEHLVNPVRVLENWRQCIRPGGVLFLYLPHPDMTYWQPQHCRKHLHTWTPAQMATLLADLGFVDVIHGERDLAWSFAVVGYNKD